MSKREISICHQTQALLYKNIIKKWRMKKESLWELLSSLGVILHLYLLSTVISVTQFQEHPSVDLGRIDKFNDSDFAIAYTPVSKMTQQIIEKVASTSFMKAHCYNYKEGFHCLLEKYWTRGFVAFQAAINSAIIEITTNHSVVDKMMAVTGIKMKMLPFISKGEILYELILFFYIISFTPLIYFASLNVTKERKKVKEWMKMMGLQDLAFW
uniref:Uncharacterized protein n=1 Tax=Monodelphis domestica TaxID=13616 RepID=A0A5F8GJS4_MONDO